MMSNDWRKCNRQNRARHLKFREEPRTNVADRERRGEEVDRRTDVAGMLAHVRSFSNDGPGVAMESSAPEE